jgi:diketogulonate reductase-like aldo/keto reductase
MASKDIPVLSAQNMSMPVIGLGTWQVSSVNLINLSESDINK